MTLRPSFFLALALAGCTASDTDPADSGVSGDTGDTAASATVQVFEACEGRDFTVTDPVDGYPWTPNAISLVSEEVAQNVFAVYDSNAADYEPAGYPLATSSGFVIGEDGVLVVDTMINRQLLCQVFELVRAETDLPVRYAVNTS